MRQKFEPSPYIEAVTDYVIEWLSQNDILLPMYLQPAEKIKFIHDMDRDPMFKKKKVAFSKMIPKIIIPESY